MLRPQMFGVVLFALCLWIVSRRAAHPMGIYLIPLIAALWANLHGSFFLAPLLLLIAGVQDAIARKPLARIPLLVAAAAAGTTLLNPFGVRVWSYALGIATNSQVTMAIEEWQPTNVRQVTGLFFFISVLGVVVVLFRRGRPSDWGSLIPLGIFFVAGLVAVRGARWWAIAAPVFLCIVFAQTTSRRPELRIRSALNTVIAGVLIAAAIAFLPWPLSQSRLPVGEHLEFAPAGITQALEQTLQPGDRIFNAQRWGSWLEFAFPSAKVFVDSRIELFADSIWGDYLAVSSGREDWQEILDRWQVRVIVAHGATQGSLIRFADHDVGWRRTFSDSEGAIFVRA